VALAAAAAAAASVRGARTSPAVFSALARAAAKNDGVIRLSGDQYTRWVERTSPRNFTLVLTLTMLNARRFGPCAPCLALRDELKVLAASYMATHGHDMRSPSFLKKPLFFAELSFEPELQPVFQQYELRGVPHVAVLKPTHDTTFRPPPATAQSSEVRTAEQLASLVKRAAGVRIGVQRPLWRKLVRPLGGVLSAAFVVLVVLPWLYRNYTSPIIPFVASLAVFFFVMAGTVFNLIRRPPLVDMDPRTGAPVYFEAGGRSQLMLEGAIVATLMCFAALAHVALNTLGTSTRFGAIGVRVVFYTCAAAYAALLLMLMHVFNYKYSFYPFRAPQWAKFLSIVPNT